MPVINKQKNNIKISSPRAGLSDEIIQVIEYLKLCTYGEIIHTSTSEVAVTEKMLSELAKHVEEREAACRWGQCERYMKPQRSQK